MENAGCVTFTEDYVFRSRVTDAAYERRAETILHELAHMWFGDLVTMRWWDDLWLNESFATWASVLCQAEATRWTEAWTTFAVSEKLWALRDVDLHLCPGTRVGVVGPSGSGKSTLAAVLLRFLDPQAGRATLGGTDLSALSLEDVRRTLVLVDDDPHVFASSVAENVRLARPGATDQEVRAALGDACLGAWVDALPDGIHTHVGDGRREVSGGERARLALARSLLADPPVLVLDEPTAHLDGPTARAVADQMLGSATRAGRSIVWITHGTVGLDAMDRVVRLDAAGRAGVSRSALVGSAAAG